MTKRIITSFGDLGEDMTVAATGSYSATAPTNCNWVMQVATFH